MARERIGVTRSALLNRFAQLRQHTIPRFLVVGVVSFAVDFGSLYLLHGLLHLALVAATVLAFCGGLAVNFVGQRAWVFRLLDRPYRRLTRFVMLAPVNAGLTVGVVAGLTHVGAYYLLAKIIAAAAIAVINYIVYRTWVFRASLDAEPLKAEMTAS